MSAVFSSTNVSCPNLAQAIFDHAASQPDKVALLSREGQCTYADLATRITRLSGALEQLGLRPGDKVGLLMYNTAAFVTAYFALLASGLVVIPLNTRLTAPELDTILNDAQAKLLITSLEFYERVTRLKTPSLEGIILDTELLTDETALDPLLNTFPLDCALYRLDELLDRALEPKQPLPCAVEHTTLATLIYTSGTTGIPKGVMLSHRNILADATANVAVIEATADDRFITISPLFHVFGQTNILVSCLLVGGTLVLVRKFSPRTVLENIARHRVSFMAAVPTMYLMMLTHLREKSFDLSSLRVCHSGAAPMAVETFHEVEKYFGAPVQEGYGLSEASSIVCSNPLHGVRKPGSVGLPLNGIQIRICLDDGSEAPPGEVGELHVKGDVVMLGYYNRPEETAQTLLSDGWLRTRDLAYKDEDGYIHIVDRVDDLINIGGVKIYPREIEEVLYRHPAVYAVAVTGVPSTLHHEAIKAFVVLKEGMTCGRETLQEFCKTYLADFKIPKYYEFVDTIPQGATGKILRKELRNRPYKDV
ncbi:MAG TPA: long-chain fatty acid--CoA ligase [Oculatellaceae cyanobacterium]|jgi:long-chain acyl-CoA synthetase